MRRRHFEGATVAAWLLACASLALAQPANDDCANATVIGSLPFTEMVDTSTATNDGDTSAGTSSCANRPNSIWYEFTAGADDVILVVDAFEGSTWDYTTIDAYTGSCGSLGADLHVVNVHRGVNLAQRVPAGNSVLICVSDQSATPGGGPIQVHVFEAPEFAIDVDGYLAETDRRAVAGGPGARFFVTWAGYDGSDEHRGRLFNANGTPAGPQLVLDSGNHFWQDATARGTSGFVAVWGHVPNVQTQLIDSSGMPVGAPFAANESPGSDGVHVAADAAGNFVVAWRGPTFRLFDAAGAPLGPEQVVSGGGGAYWLDVARDAAGDFVIVWEDSYEIAGQRFDATGTPMGSPFVASSGYAYQPSVAAAPTGDFLVAWEGDYNGVFGQAFDASGAPDGATLELSTPGSEYANHRPNVASDDAGDFVVVWEDDGGRTDYSFQIDIAGRRVGPGGTPLGSEFAVNTVNAGFQYWPAVGVAPGGEFLVAWGDSAGYEPWGVPPPEAVIGRGFGADGGPPPPPPTVHCPSTSASGCRATILPGKSKLLVRNDGTDPEDLVINWKLVRAEATAAADFGDPVTSDDLFFCLYDDTGGSAGGALVTEAALPAGGLCAGKPCWKGLGKPAGAKGFKYKDKERTPNGVLKAVLKAGDEGKAKIVFKAGRGNLATGPAGGPPAVPIVGSLTAQLHAPATGTCWGATFDAATAKRNSAGIFQASGD